VHIFGNPLPLKMKCIVCIMTTANGQYNYSMKIGDLELRTLVQMTHKYNCEQNHWKVTALKEGCFGFDNLAVCIGYAEASHFDTEDIDSLADIIHQGWAINYIYWRDNRPWEGGNYVKPAKPLNDARRNELATLSFGDLPEDEKEKDRIIARYLFSYLI
jgi:hypothetical protein